MTEVRVRPTSIIWLAGGSKLSLLVPARLRPRGGSRPEEEDQERGILIQFETENFGVEGSTMGIERTTHSLGVCRIDIGDRYEATTSIWSCICGLQNTPRRFSSRGEETVVQVPVGHPVGSARVVNPKERNFTDLLQGLGYDLRKFHVDKIVAYACVW
jgi:hypothetical protein